MRLVPGKQVPGTKLFLKDYLFIKEKYYIYRPFRLG